MPLAGWILQDGDRADDYLRVASLFGVFLNADNAGPEDLVVVVTTPRWFQFDVLSFACAYAVPSDCVVRHGSPLKKRMWSAQVWGRGERQKSR